MQTVSFILMHTSLKTMVGFGGGTLILSYISMFGPLLEVQNFFFFLGGGGGGRGSEK